MTGYTANYLLPYQTGTDAPCDAPEAWCDLVEKVDAQQRAVEVSLARLFPAVPAVGLSFTPATPVILPDTLSDIHVITFDTVLFDTDGMFDASRSSQRIFPQRPGWYFFDGWVKFTSTGGIPNFADLFITADIFGASADGFGSSIGNIAEEMTCMYTTGGAFPFNYLRASVMRPLYADVTGITLGFPQTFDDPLGYGLGFQLADLFGSQLVGARLEAYWVRDI